MMSFSIFMRTKNSRALNNVEEDKRCESFQNFVETFKKKEVFF